MVAWSTLPNAGTNGDESISLAKIENEFDGATNWVADGLTPIQLSDYYEGGGLVPEVAWNYRIPNTPGDPISLNDFYGAVWGTFVNYAMVGGGGGGGAGSSSGRGSNNVGNGNAGGQSNISMDTDTNFADIAFGGAGGLHGDSNNWNGGAGGDSIFGTGGALTPQNSVGQAGTGWGSGGAGGGGDQDSGKGDTLGYGGTGGSAGTARFGGSPNPFDVNNVKRYKYNSVITFSPGLNGTGGTGSFRNGGSGTRGRVGITYDGDTYYYDTAVDHILGSFATIDDVP